MANYTKLPRYAKPNLTVKYTSRRGKKVTMQFVCEEKMNEWIEAVAYLNKMSGTEFSYTIEKAVH